MVVAPSPVIDLPRRRGVVTVRQGGLDDDLDALHDGDPLWWGKDFLAERIASAPPEDPSLVLVAEVDGDPVGYGFLIAKGLRAGGRAMAELYVLPRGRGHGAGRALLDAMADETRARGLPGLLASMPDDDPASLGAVLSWGCREVGHHRESVLDLDTLDDDLVEALLTRVEEAGVTLAALTPDTDEAQWQRVYDLIAGLWADAPDGAGATDTIPYSVWRGFFTDPAYVLVASRDGEPVGADMLMDRSKDDALNILFVCVAPQARGLGLSAALMARHAQLMRAQGHHLLYTQNMLQNSRILAANDRLRFRPVSGYLDLAYDLGDQTPRS